MLDIIFFQLYFVVKIPSYCRFHPFFYKVTPPAPAPPAPAPIYHQYWLMAVVVAAAAPRFYK